MREQTQDDIAWGYMLGQHQGKARLEALVRSVFATRTTLVDALDRVCTSLELESAFGAHLDNIGSIVGVTRDLPEGLYMAYFGFASQPAGRAFNTLRMRRDGEEITTAYTAGDGEYKTLIKLKILMNNARGTIPEITEAVRSVFNDPTLPVSVRQNGTAKAKIVIGRVPDAEDPTPQLLVDRVPRPAGVTFDFEYYRSNLEVDFLSGVPDDDMSFLRSTVATYIDADGFLRYAAVDEPRFGGDPNTGLPLGLLQEPSSQNMFSYTESPSNGYWEKFNSGMTDNAVVGPDGTTNASKMVVLSGSSSGNFSRVPTGAVADSTYTCSAFIKDEGWVVLCNAIGTTATFQMQFYEVGSPYTFKGGGTVKLEDMSLSSVNGSNGSTVTHEIKKLANGWARYSCTVTFAGTPAAQVQARMILGYSGAAPVADGVAGIGVFGMQFEGMRRSTSYFRNVGGTQDARAADIVDFSAIGKNWNNDDSGTMFLEYVEYNASTSGTALLMSLSKDADEYTRIRSAYGAIPRLEAIILNVATEWDSAMYPITIDDITRVALSYSNSGAALFLNGVKRTSIGSYNRPRGYTSLQIRAGNNPRYLRKASVFPFKKTDSDLIAATAL